MDRNLPGIVDAPLCRREFLRRCGAGAVVLGLAFGLPRRLSAKPLPLDWIDGTARGGESNEVGYPIPAADGVSVDRERELILVRAGEAVYAFGLSCPHQRSMLKWREKEGLFKCTKHGSKYEPSGEYVSGRATRGMDRYPIRVEGQEILVDLSRKFLQDEDPAGWEGAVALVG